MTTKLAVEISRSSDRPVRWLKALRSTSITSSARKTVTAAAATVSYLRWPYGWSSSGGCRAAYTPIKPATFDAASVSEWKPSDRMLIAPLA
jgi:hypothetical protein